VREPRRGVIRHDALTDVRAPFLLRFGAI